MPRRRRVQPPSEAALDAQEAEWRFGWMVRGKMPVDKADTTKAALWKKICARAQKIEAKAKPATAKLEELEGFLDELGELDGARAFVAHLEDARARSRRRDHGKGRRK